MRNVTETEAFISLKRPNHSVSSYLVYVKDLNGETEERRLRITRTKSSIHSFSLKSLSAGSTFLISVQSIEATQKSKSNIATFMTVPKAVEKLRYQAFSDVYAVHGSLVIFKLDIFRVKNVEASSCLLMWRPPMMNNSDFVNIEVEYKKQGMWIKSVKHRLNSTISSIPLNQLKPGVRSARFIDVFGISMFSVDRCFRYIDVFGISMFPVYRWFRLIDVLVESTISVHRH